VRVLPDTSVWVEFLRKGKAGPAGDLDRLLQRESVFVCGPVLAEVLAGTPPERQEELVLALGALPWADLNHEGWRQVGEVAQALRRSGRSIPLTDIEIAVACLRAEASLWTRDRDFDYVREVLPGLKLHRSP